MKYLIILTFSIICVSTAFANNQSEKVAAWTRIFDAAGNNIGKATFSQHKKIVTIKVKTRNLPVGFHGFHVHTTGICDSTITPVFSSAGGHFKLDANSTHQNHSGDLPILLVNGNGTGEMTFQTDRFKVTDLLDADGSALIIHANPDNFANIPADRYALIATSPTFPDGTTLATGDAGNRIGCGVIKKLGKKS